MTRARHIAGALWGRRSRWQRVLIALVLALALGPVLLVGPLRFLDPPFTALIISRAVDRSGRGISPAFGVRRLVRLAQISAPLQRAVLASEDDGFYLHHGFDVTQIRKAIVSKRQGGRLRGASTISQQTVKNIFLWSGRSFVRKALEAYLTVYLELLVPKDRILELYLNLVECADGVYGVEAGSTFYFMKSASQIESDEAAHLAAVLPSPRKITPYSDYANERAAQILEIMEYPIQRPR
jgi:monofunctional biosynthetic peptidoglycan transglycosylase